MVLRFFMLVCAFLFTSCTSVERDNPYDPNGINYIGDAYAYCLYYLYYNSDYTCSYMSASECDWNYGDAYGDDYTCGQGLYVPSSSSSRPNSSSSFRSSSSSRQSGVIHGVSVTYGSETYETVVIGTQTWMAKNLNYEPSGTGVAKNSKCYNNEPTNCTRYGRLYDWATAMGISSSYNSSYYNPSANTKYRGVCPSGWHIPNNADWDKLMRYVDGTSGTSSPYDSPTAGIYLTATSGWNSSGNGQDTYGFSALPGGSGYSGGSFDDVGYLGYWWSASEDFSYSADIRDMGCIVYVGYDGHGKGLLVSVRCVQD